MNHERYALLSQRDRETIVEELLTSVPFQNTDLWRAAAIYLVRTGQDLTQDVVDKISRALLYSHEQFSVHILLQHVGVTTRNHPVLNRLAFNYEDERMRVLSNQAGGESQMLATFGEFVREDLLAAGLREEPLYADQSETNRSIKYSPVGSPGKDVGYSGVRRITRMFGGARYQPSTGSWAADSVFQTKLSATKVFSILIEGDLVRAKSRSPQGSSSSPHLVRMPESSI